MRIRIGEEGARYESGFLPSPPSEALTSLEEEPSLSYDVVPKNEAEGRKIYQCIDSVNGSDKEKSLAQALLKFDGHEDSFNLKENFSPKTEEYFKKYFPQKTETGEVPPTLQLREDSRRWEPELLQALTELGIDTSDLVEEHKFFTDLVIPIRVADPDKKEGRIDEFVFRPAQAARFVQSALGLTSPVKEEQKEVYGNIDDMFGGPEEGSPVTNNADAGRQEVPTYVSTVIDGVSGTENQKGLVRALLNFDGSEEVGSLKDYFSQPIKEHFKKYVPTIEGGETIPAELTVKESAKEWEPELLLALIELGVDVGAITGGVLTIRARVPDQNGQEGRIDEFVFTPAQMVRFMQSILGYTEKTNEAETVSYGSIEGIFDDVSIKTASEGFESEFNITEKELETIPGYTSLSKGQKQLLFENFNQLTLGSVKEEAIRLYGQGNEEASKKYKNKYTAAFGGALRGLKEVFTKDIEILKNEKQVVSDMRSGGMSLHKEMITQLVGSLATFGPKVNFEKHSGEITVDLVNIQEHFSSKHGTEWNGVVSSVNEAAHAFARTPASWRGKTLGVDDDSVSEGKLSQWFKSKFSTERKNQLAYAAAEKDYHLARKRLEEICQEEKKSDGEIAFILNGLDTRVHQLQMLQTSPEAVSELADIEDKNIYVEAAKKLFSNGALGYMSLGFVGHTVLGSMAGHVGAPLVSSGVAWLKSRSKTADDLRLRDQQARMGIGNVDPIYRQLLLEMKEVYAKDPKSTEYKESVERLNQYQGNGELNIVSAREMAEKTKRLIDTVTDWDEKLSYATSQNDDEAVTYFNTQKDRALQSLLKRIEYIGDKQALQRVSYGTRNEQVSNQTLLYQTLGEALALTSLSPSPGANSRLEQKLESKLATTEERIITVRKQLRNRELRASVVKAASFSLAGAALGEFYEQYKSPTVATFAPSPEVVEPGAEATTSTLTEQATEVEVGGRGVMAAETISVSKEAIPEALYVVRAGDTLSEIVTSKLPEQENVLQGLKSLTAEEVRNIGLRSGDIDMIYPEESINLTLLQKILTEKG